MIIMLCNELIHFSLNQTKKSQLIMSSTSKYFAEGSLIADSRETATSLMVITSGQVGVELPMDSVEADEENKKEHGKTLLYIFGRG